MQSTLHQKAANLVHEEGDVENNYVCHLQPARFSCHDGKEEGSKHHHNPIGKEQLEHCGVEVAAEICGFVSWNSLWRQWKRTCAPW